MAFPLAPPSAQTMWLFFLQFRFVEFSEMCSVTRNRRQKKEVNVTVNSGDGFHATVSGVRFYC